MTEDDWTELDALARAPRVVGVGETGLDYYYDHSPREAAAGRLPALRRDGAARPGCRVVSHVRDAHADAAAILREPGTGAGVIHCFTGGVAEARAYLDLGQYLSFSGILTFKNAGNDPRGGGVRAARPHPDRDRRALPGAHPPPGRSERAGLHRRDAGRAGARCAVCRRPRSTPPPRRTRGACLRFARSACRPASTRMSVDGYSLPRELQLPRPDPAPLRVLRHLHREVRAERHPRRRLPRQPHAAPDRVRRSPSRSSWRAARSRWRATARSSGSSRTIRPRRRSRTAWACSSCASTSRRASS